MSTRKNRRTATPTPRNTPATQQVSEVNWKEAREQDQKARIERALAAIDEILERERCVITTNNIQLTPDGRMIPNYIIAALNED